MEKTVAQINYNAKITDKNKKQWFYVQLSGYKLRYVLMLFHTENQPNLIDF